MKEIWNIRPSAYYSRPTPPAQTLDLSILLQSSSLPASSHTHHSPVATSLSLLSPLRYRRQRSSSITATAHLIPGGSSLIWSLDCLLSFPLAQIRQRNPRLPWIDLASPLSRPSPPRAVQRWQGAGGAREEAAT
jgi:hypothetical protein